MTKQTWIIATVLSLAALVGFYSLNATHRRNSAQARDSEVERLHGLIDKAAAEVAQLQAQLEDKAGETETLRQEKERVASAQQTLEQQMREALQTKDVTISELRGRLTLNIVDRILFDSGEAILKPEGQKILEKIAGILRQYPGRQIHVNGHTDDVPIRAAARARFPSNWELSMARATAAVRFLAEEAGVNPRQLGAVGYGEFRPVSENSSVEGRAKNRRIEVIILPEEFALAPPAPASTNTNTNTSTNTPALAPDKDLPLESIDSNDPP